MDNKNLYLLFTLINISLQAGELELTMARRDSGCSLGSLSIASDTQQTLEEDQFEEVPMIVAQPSLHNNDEENIGEIRIPSKMHTFLCLKCSDKTCECITMTSIALAFTVAVVGGCFYGFESECFGYVCDECCDTEKYYLIKPQTLTSHDCCNNEELYHIPYNNCCTAKCCECAPLTCCHCK